MLTEGGEEMSMWAKKTEPSAGQDKLDKALKLEELSPAEREKFRARLYAPPVERKTK